MKEAPEDIFAMTSSIDNSPDSPQEVEIIFKNGFPVGINDESLAPLEIIKKANVLAGEHGFGRIDMIEDRVVGIKSWEKISKIGKKIQTNWSNIFASHGVDSVSYTHLTLPTNSLV